MMFIYLSKMFDCACLVAQLYLTLCNTKDYSLPGSSVHGFSRQKYWSELPVSSPGGLLDPGIDPEAAAMSPPLLAGSLPLSHWRSLGYHQKCSKKKKKK